MMNKTALLALFALLAAACLEAGTARKRIEWSLPASELAVGTEKSLEFCWNYRPIKVTKKFTLSLERPGWFQPSRALDATFTEVGDDCVAVKFTVPNVAAADNYHLRLKRRFAWFLTRSYNPSGAFAIVKSDAKRTAYEDVEMKYEMPAAIAAKEQDLELEAEEEDTIPAKYVPAYAQTEAAVPVEEQEGDDDMPELIEDDMPELKDDQDVEESESDEEEEYLTNGEDFGADDMPGRTDDESGAEAESEQEDQDALAELQADSVETDADQYAPVQIQVSGDVYTAVLRHYIIQREMEEGRMPNDLPNLIFNFNAAISKHDTVTFAGLVDECKKRQLSLNTVASLIDLEEAPTNLKEIFRRAAKAQNLRIAKRNKKH